MDDPEFIPYDDDREEEDYGDSVWTPEPSKHLKLFPPGTQLG